MIKNTSSSEDYEECLNIIAWGTSSVMEHILPALILIVESGWKLFCVPQCLDLLYFLAKAGSAVAAAL
jgi:hypothetical protein